MNSLHMDASPNLSRSRSSVGSPDISKSKDTTMIHLRKPKNSKENYGTKQPGAYSNLEDQRNHNKDQSIEDSIRYIGQMSEHSSRDNENTETYRVSNDGVDVDHRFHQIN